MAVIAFLTMDRLDGFFAYDHLAIPWLESQGHHVEMVSWRKPNVRWSDYSLVVIRSPWDYQQDAPAFLRVLEEIAASGTVLQNSLAIVRWNIHKSYLRDLQAGGVPIVPTVWSTGFRPELLSSAFEQFGASECVVKPVVGANADDTFRLTRGSISVGDDGDQLTALFRDRELMIQPFLDSIVTEGEYSLFYFNGGYSHAILKRPAQGDFRVQEEHGGEVTATQPSADIEAVARAAIAAIPEPTLYARADIVRLADGRPAVIELELIEPSLYLGHSSTAPQLFANAIADRTRFAIHESDHQQFNGQRIERE